MRKADRGSRIADSEMQEMLKGVEIVFVKDISFFELADLSEHYGQPVHQSVVAETRAPYGTIRSFEDLLAWQSARAFVKKIYAITSIPPFSKDFRLSGQIESAAVSMMSNIAEGHEKQGINSFIQFLSIARGSCGETRSLLYVAMDIGYIDQKLFKELHADVITIGKLISGLMNSLEKARSGK